jgi:hypothetical protein
MVNRPDSITLWIARISSAPHELLANSYVMQKILAGSNLVIPITPCRDFLLPADFV